MNKEDVLDRLGEPDKVLKSGGMVSTDWMCSKCNHLHSFDTPVRPPAPCACGSIFFSKKARVLQ